MKKLLLAAAILGLLLPRPIDGSLSQKPSKSTESPTADEIVIYREVLRQFAPDDSGAAGTVNVSVATYPVDPNDPNDGLSCSFPDGIQPANLATASRAFHELPQDVLPNKMTHLVDPKKQAKMVHNNDPSKTIREGKSVALALKDAYVTALLSLSEIVFDKEHTHAMVSYRFWCGSLCGSGKTLIFEKVGNEWKKTGNCADWIA
jgi:hypothetical protein